MDASTDENYFSADDGADTRNSSAKSLNTLLGREGGGVMNHHPNRSQLPRTDSQRQDPKLHAPGRHSGPIPEVVPHAGRIAASSRRGDVEVQDITMKSKKTRRVFAKEPRRTKIRCGSHPESQRSRREGYLCLPSEVRLGSRCSTADDRFSRSRK